MTEGEKRADDEALTRATEAGKRIIAGILDASVTALAKGIADGEKAAVTQARVRATLEKALASAGFAPEQLVLFVNQTMRELEATLDAKMKVAEGAGVGRIGAAKGIAAQAPEAVAAAKATAAANEAQKRVFGGLEAPGGIKLEDLFIEGFRALRNAPPGRARNEQAQQLNRMIQEMTANALAQSDLTPGQVAKRIREAPSFFRQQAEAQFRREAVAAGMPGAAPAEAPAKAAPEPGDKGAPKTKADFEAEAAAKLAEQMRRAGGKRVRQPGVAVPDLEEGGFGAPIEVGGGQGMRSVGIGPQAAVEQKVIRNQGAMVNQMANFANQLASLEAAADSVLTNLQGIQISSQLRGRA
jgi:hypothetical protein